MVEPLCSTPFGVRDRCGRRKHNLCIVSACSTPFGVRDRCGVCQSTPARSICGAQRLSASEIGADTCTGLGATGMGGAQRLSASEIGAVIWFWVFTWLWVLCSTPFGVRDRCGASDLRAFLETEVLNAFRRQRSVRSRFQRIPQRPVRCSTPFGVRDRCGRRTTAKYPTDTSAQRLSASEIGAEVRDDVVSALQKCSTPFGVRDRCGLKPRANE